MKAKPKNRWLLSIASGVSEGRWVGLTRITPELVETIRRMQQVIKDASAAGLELTEVATHSLATDYFEAPETRGSDGPKLSRRKPKVGEAKRTACDEMVVNQSSVWWRCFDHYDDESAVINTDPMPLECIFKEME